MLCNDSIPSWYLISCGIDKFATVCSTGNFSCISDPILKYLYDWKENKIISLNKIKSNIKTKLATIFLFLLAILLLILPQKVSFWKPKNRFQTSCRISLFFYLKTFYGLKNFQVSYLSYFLLFFSFFIYFVN